MSNNNVLSQVEIDGEFKTVTSVAALTGDIDLLALNNVHVNVDTGSGIKRAIAVANLGGGGAVTSGSTNKFKPLTIGYAGDSISLYWGQQGGLSPLWWISNYLYPCSMENIFTSGINGSLSSSLLDTQIELLEAEEIKPDLMIVQTTQNDPMASNYETTAEASALNVTTYCDRALVSGVENIIIGAHPPKDPLFGDEPRAFEYLNRILSSYADNTKGVTFVDLLSLWRLAPTGADPALGGINWQTRYTVDKIHPTTEAMYECAKVIKNTIVPLVQAKTTQSIVAESYNDVTAIYSSVYGLDSYMIGTGGKYNTVLDTRVAGSNEDSLGHWLLSDGNGVTATPAIVVGDDGYNYQQLTLGGTATSDATIALTKQIVSAVSLGLFVLNAKLHLNNLQNVETVTLTTDLGVNVITDDGHNLVGDNELEISYSAEHSNPGYSATYPKLEIEVKNGESPTGVIQLGRIGLYRQVD